MALFKSAVFMAIMSLLGYNVCVAAPCSLEESSVCIQGLTSLDPSDTGKMCRDLVKNLDCFDQLEKVCELPDKMKSQFEQFQSQIPQLKILCNTDDVCSFQKLTACTSGMDAIGTELDITKMCSVAQQVRECLTPMLKCEVEELRGPIQKAMVNLDQMCANIDSGCSAMDMSKCMVPFESSGKDHTKLCGLMKSAMECLTAMKPKCTKDQLETLQQTLDKMEPIDDNCCESVAKIATECNQGVEDFAENFEANDDLCLKIENALVCANKYAPNCKTGPMKQGMDEAFKGMTKRLNQCTDKGYNRTTSLESNSGKKGNDGVTLHPTIAIIVSVLLMGLITFCF